MRFDTLSAFDTGVKWDAGFAMYYDVVEFMTLSPPRLTHVALTAGGFYESASCSSLIRYLAATAGSERAAGFA